MVTIKDIVVSYSNQREQLDNHLNETNYLRAHDIVSYVVRNFKVAYSISGMTNLLHRLNY